MTDPSAPGASAPRRAGRLAARRGLALVGLTTLLPGSMHLVLGRRRVGRVALAVWSLGVLALVAGAVTFLVDRTLLVGLVASGWVLRILAAAVLVGGIGWAALVVDALRLSRPGRLRPASRVGLVAFTLLCVGAILAASVWLASFVRSAARLSDSVFGGGGTTETIQGRYNILLLGADDGADREGARIDSINVVSVDAATGKAVLVGLPRNLEGVPFPVTSPMHDLYPDGYACPDRSCLLNAINTTVEAEHADLYPGVRRPGLQATKEAVEATTGLRINYYVVIDLSGFQTLVDAVGGVRIALDKAVPIWWDATETEVTYAIGPGRDIHLDGEKTLWFVRARSDSNDYVRMSRQRCVMSAMLQQLDPAAVLAHFTDIAAASVGMVATDAPATEAGRLSKVALKVRRTPYETLPLTPPLINPFDLIRRLVAQAVKRTEPSPTPTPTPSATPSTTPSSTPTAGASPSTSASTGAGRGQATPSRTPRVTPTPTPTPDPTPEPEPVQVEENCRPA